MGHALASLVSIVPPAADVPAARARVYPELGEEIAHGWAGPRAGAGVVRESAGSIYRAGAAHGRVRPRPAVAPDSPVQSRPARRPWIDNELFTAMHAVRYLERRILREEARLLNWTSHDHRYRTLGFNSFADFARTMQMAPRTAQEHVRLHRLLEGRPVAAEAFRAGDLSLYQVLALAPVLRVADLDPAGEIDWITEARGCTVQGLNRKVRAEVKRLADLAAGDAQEPGPGSLASGASDGSSPAASSSMVGRRWEVTEDDRDGPLLGRTVRFEAPPVAVLAWDRAMETASKVLGWDAPVYQRVEAILAEASPHTAVVHGDDHLGTGGDRGCASSGSSGLPMATAAPGHLGHNSEVHRPIHVPARIRRRVKDTLERTCRCLAEIAALEKAAPPEDAGVAVERLVALRRLGGSSKVLLAKVLHDLRLSGAMVRAGFVSVERLVEGFRLSERAAHDLCRLAQVLEQFPAIRRACAEGRISSEQARLIGRLAGAGNVEAYIDRAEGTTCRQFLREARVLEHLRMLPAEMPAWHARPLMVHGEATYGPGNVYAVPELVPGPGSITGPLPQPRLEPLLFGFLERLGRSREMIERELRKQGLALSDGGAGGTQVAGEADDDSVCPADPRDPRDPAQNPVMLLRLEALLEMAVEAEADTATIVRREDDGTDLPARGSSTGISGCSGDSGSGGGVVGGSGRVDGSGGVGGEGPELLSVTGVQASAHPAIPDLSDAEDEAACDAGDERAAGQLSPGTAVAGTGLQISAHPAIRDLCEAGNEGAVAGQQSASGATAAVTGLQTSAHPAIPDLRDAGDEAAFDAGDEGAAAEQPSPSEAAAAVTGLQSSARLHATLNQGRRDFALGRRGLMIRFWAPHQVADDWYAAIRAIRSEYVVRMAPPDLDALRRPSPAGGDSGDPGDPGDHGDPGDPGDRKLSASYTEPVPVWTAAMILLAQATSVWENTDPETEPTERLILERDRCHCTVPGCSRRASLEVHHMVFRSQGGTNARSNRTTICHGHHRQVHEEHLRITGEAPHALTYEFGLGLGPIEPGSSRRGPVWVFYGEKLVRGPGYVGARARGGSRGAPAQP